MRLFFNLSFYLSLMFTTSSIADSKQISTTDEQQIKALYANYMQRYNHYLTHSTLPLEQKLYSNQVMTLNGKGQNVVSTEQFNKQVVFFLDGLKKAGVTKVKWQDINITMLSNSVALVSNIAVRYKADDEVHNRVGATYLINKTGKNWLISAFTVHQAENVISV